MKLPLWLTLALIPFNRDVTSVQIFYYDGIKQPERLIETLESKDVDPQKPLKLIIHGWIADRNHAAIGPVVNAYRLRNDVTLMVADWREMSYQNYIDSRFAIESVGIELGKKLKHFATEMNIESKNIHLIGHSLGAHVSAKIGKLFKGQIGRITGLDPAQPLFIAESHDVISKNDAQFVDIIHSASKILGIFEPLGHVDFYPNFGVPSQPGCEMLDVLNAFSCSHYKAPLYFAESVLLPYNFVGYKVTFRDIKTGDKKAMRKRRNADKIAYLGEGLDLRCRGIFYLETNARFPLGQGAGYNV